jgi:hypothetical protein
VPLLEAVPSPLSGEPELFDGLELFDELELSDELE